MRYALSGKCLVTQVHEGGQDVLVVKGPCYVTGEMQTVKVSLASFQRWHRGAYIQDAMSELSADEREFLISGISAEGWDLMLAAQDDQEALEPDGSYNCVD